MANKKLFIMLCLLVTAGLVAVGFMFSKKALPPVAPDVTIPAPIEQVTTTITLASGTVMKMPKAWTIQTLPPDTQYQTYEISASDNEVPMTEVNISEWLKGPRADEGYVIANEKRPQALKVLQDVYAHQEVADADRKSFDAMAGEFLGYSDKYRSALSYIASNDNAWRGISFYNLIGQDIGVSPIYYVALYNPDANAVLFANYYLTQATPEVAAANAKLRAIDWTKNQNEKLLNQLDLEARERFKATVEKMPRKDLSFGAALDELDVFMKTASRRK